MTSYRDELLHDILSQPSAPFREGHVISIITSVLQAASVPHFQDPIGNVMIGISSQAEYQRVIKKKTPEPIRLFMAHMDHPGFHGVVWNAKNELEIRWHGGSPTQHLEGAKVWLANRTDWRAEGELREAQLLPSGRALQSGWVKEIKGIKNHGALPAATDIFGGFSFRAPVWKEGQLLYTKAADDLVGAFAIVSLALEALGTSKKRKSRSSAVADTPWIGLLTRAEEVGFLGAIGHLNLGWLQQATRPVVCVSLETSRTLPGAEVGKGPVIRLGDKYTVFDPGALRVLIDLAQQVLPEKHQRRIMDGGTCEATAATVFDFPSVGISIPLGNYHNQSLEGGPDSAPPHGPAPEFVHTEDIAGLIDLCQALIKSKLPWNNPWKHKMKEFKKEMKNYRQLLQSRP